MSFLSSMNAEEIFFPHSKIRDKQTQLVQDIHDCIKDKKNLVAHAPTGLGKTAAALAPALFYAMKKDLTIFFLTSKHTQHQIAIETLKIMKQKHKLDFRTADLIGKQSMCPVPGVRELYSNEFYEYCKTQKEENKCEHHTNTRKKSGKPTVQAEYFLSKLETPYHCEEIVKECEKEKLCAYEISAMVAEKAKVIISDYSYIFNPHIRELIFNKTKKSIEDCIVIIDEGHNLPRRIRDLMTDKLSTFMIQRAIKEARKFKYNDTESYLESIRDALEELAVFEDNFPEQEKLIKKQEFMDKINSIEKYDELIAHFEFISEEIKKKQQKSSMGGIASFLEAWLGEDKSFARILTKKMFRGKKQIILAYRCLDPSLLTKEIIQNAHSTIIMSGTLSPTSMYRDLLGFPKDMTLEKEYPSPFPPENRLSMIIPHTTTKFTRRSVSEYKRIAAILARTINSVPGNSAVFFPSYKLRDEVNEYFKNICTKTIFSEQPRLSKEEKQDLLERFKSYEKTGAVLLGVSSANFAEGIDLPGDLLKAVIVVGLPLQRPDLETKELIDYYEDKFRNGTEYGYIFPAMTKCFQSAGRCIRTGKDRGVIIFLDERYVWNTYRKYFPSEWNTQITNMYKEKIEDFFKK
ncbi:DEAD/DEAH box helicase [Candidatus Woesearchaeota archaeon]|nr:DEAD/DEAH box helicase [Candidatus Woesearchaeota archaeon]